MNPNPRAAICALNMGVAVALGALGAHAIKDRISADMMTIYHTGSQYHLVVGALLLALSWQKDVPKWFFTFGLLGTLFFSGSLYALALSGVRIWGAVTPIGGVIWIGSLFALAYFAAPKAKLAQNVEQNDENTRSDN